MTRCSHCGRTTWLYPSGIRACGHCDLMLGMTGPNDLQADCDRIIRGTVYDWEREGDL